MHSAAAAAHRSRDAARAAFAPNLIAASVVCVLGLHLLL
jgi:hypothetical protein